MQEEKKGLSRREKVLLLIALIIAITAGMVQFVFIPLNNSLAEGRNTIGELELEKASIELRLSSEQIIKQNHAAALENHEQMSSKILSQSQSNEIGRMLTTLCKKHAMDPISQRINAPTVYVLITEVADPDTGIVRENREDTVFLTVSANMSVSGNYGQLKRLLNEVSSISYLRVTRISFNRNLVEPDISIFGTDGTGGIEALALPVTYEIDTITIDFEVTMLGS